MDLVYKDLASKFAILDSLDPDCMVVVPFVAANQKKEPWWS
jgi:hypothetical protein